MGFSALDGMPMGTRSGQLDPGVILHFLDRGMSAEEITTLLYKQSGLLGPLWPLPRHAHACWNPT
jgi:acetate kinase